MDSIAGCRRFGTAVLTRALDTVVDAGNTVLVVEHDPMLLATCGWLIEMGPSAGPAGGEIIFQGLPEELAKGNTPTAPYLLEVLPCPRSSRRSTAG